MLVAGGITRGDTAAILDEIAVIWPRRNRTRGDVVIAYWSQNRVNAGERFPAVDACLRVEAGISHRSKVVIDLGRYKS